ncbi:hypothetical protein ABPG74_015903 [Tetrahymena malaccensis]
MGSYDLKDIVCPKCCMKNPSLNSKRQSQQTNQATSPQEQHTAVQQGTTNKMQRTNSLKGNTINLKNTSPTQMKFNNNCGSPSQISQVVSGFLTEREIYSKKQSSKYNNYLDGSIKKNLVSPSSALNLKNQMNNQQYNQLQQQHIQNSAANAEGGKKLSPESKMNQILQNNNYVLGHHSSLPYNNINSIQNPLSIIGQANHSPNPVNSITSSLAQNNINSPGIGKQKQNKNQNSSNMTNSCSMNNFSTQQQSHLSHVNNSLVGGSLYGGQNSSLNSNITISKTVQNVRKQSLTSAKNQPQAQKEKINNQVQQNQQQVAAQSFVNQSVNADEFNSNQQEAYYQSEIKDNSLEKNDKIQRKASNKIINMKEKQIDDQQRNQKKQLDVLISTQQKKNDPTVKQQQLQQHLKLYQSPSVKNLKKGAFNSNINIYKNKEVSGNSSQASTAAFKHNSNQQFNFNSESMHSNYHHQNIPKGVQSQSTSAADQNSNNLNQFIDSSTSRSPQASINQKSLRAGENQVISAKNANMNQKNSINHDRIAQKSQGYTTGSYDIIGSNGQSSQQGKSQAINNQCNDEITVYFPPEDNFLHNLQSPDNYNSDQDNQIEHINKQYISSVLEQDPNVEIQGSNQSEQQQNNKEAIYQQLQHISQLQNQAAQATMQETQNELAQQQNQYQFQSIQNLKNSLKISINQANMNKINEGGMGTLNSGISSNLYQIQEKDSQQNTQRQQSVDQHFLSNINWQNIELIQKFYCDFKNGEQIKCQIHSDIVSLYCEKDKSLLCVSCLFESEEHSKHTVIPLKAAIQSISNNTNLYRNQLKEKVNNIEDDLKKCVANRSIIERSFEKCLDTLNKEFQILKNQINQKQKQLEDKIIKSFESSLFKYDTLIADLREIKTCVIESNKFNPIPSTTNNIELLIKDHFIFDTLNQTLKQVKLSIVDIKKQDLEILTLKYRQDIKNCIDEFGTIKFLHDHHIGIKKMDTTSFQSIANSNMNSPQSKQKNPSSKSSARDTTNSISPTRYNYVQRTIQAHFSQKAEIQDRRGNLNKKIQNTAANMTSNKQSQISSANEITPRSHPLNAKAAGLQYSSMNQNSNSNIHNSQINQSNINNSHINNSNINNYSSNNNTNNNNQAILNSINALSYKNSILNQSQNQIQQLSSPNNNNNNNNNNINIIQNESLNHSNLNSQYSANSYQFQHLKQKQSQLSQKLQTQQQAQQNFQNQIPLTDREHVRPIKNEKNSTTSLFLQNKRYREQQGQSTSIN